MSELGRLLQTSKIAKIIELISLFLVAYIFIMFFAQFSSDNLILGQLIIWLANVIMLSIVWIGLKLRGQSWEAFGLTFQKTTWRDAFRVFLLSLLVFVLAVLGFAIGSVIMANITGIPESADMSSYDYLKDNIWMLLLTLTGVYIVSSFGEEVIYRGFLINRIMELGLDNKTGRILAVLISAVIFGIAHFGWGPMGMVQTGFMGLVLGSAYLILKKRLWILIIAHAYMDTILMVQLYMASN